MDNHNPDKDSIPSSLLASQQRLLGLERHRSTPVPGDEQEQQRWHSYQLPTSLRLNKPSRWAWMRLGASSPWQRLTPAALGALAAALLVLWVKPSSEYGAAKGQWSIELKRHRQGGGISWQPGMPLAANDIISFTVTSHQPGVVHAAVTDHGGQLLTPTSIDMVPQQHLEPLQPHTFTSGFKVTSPSAHEYLSILLCPQDLRPEQLRQAFQGQGMNACQRRIFPLGSGRGLDK